VVHNAMIYKSTPEVCRPSGGYLHETRWSKHRRERSQLVDATARALCVADNRAHRKPELIAKHFSENAPVPGPCENRYAGGLAAVKERIAHGNLGIEDQVRPWTGGFWKGLLLMSGAVRPESSSRPRRYQVWELAHAELVQDLEEATVPLNLETKTGPNGVRRFTQCYVMDLPADDEADILAGLFAGSRLLTLEEEDWLVLSAKAETLALLQAWTVPFRQAPSFRGTERIAVSPFFAAFFTPRMPPYSAQRITACRKPALCPLVPFAVWDWYFGRKGQRLPPRSCLLPFLPSARTFRRRRIDRSSLHRSLVLDLGICGFAEPMLRLIREWHEAACGERGIEP
jgi:hypothetical protein